MEAPSKRRLNPTELLTYGQQILVGKQQRHPLFLAIQLNRSDHLQALARQQVANGVLTEVLRRIESRLQPEDRYCLASHNDIWVILADVTNPSVAKLAAVGFRESLATTIAIGDGINRFTAQLQPVIGGAWSPADGVGIQGLLQGAWDGKVLAASTEDQINVRQIGADDSAARMMEIEQAVRQVLYANELEVHFQPQIDLAEHRCRAAEALIRWPADHPLKINPATLAGICTDRGMIGQMTQFVINTVLRNQMMWQAQGMDVCIAVNLSAKTANDPGFAAQVSQSCETWGVSPERLCFELTEDSIVRNEAATIECMHALRNIGCELAIDDFGTGYSSFGYLRQFPVHELKMDRMFIKDLHHDHGDQQIVQALINLAHGFNLRALAEGIDNPEGAHLLHQYGCDRVQGWLYSKALPAEGFQDWVTRFNRGDQIGDIPRVGVRTDTSGQSVAKGRKSPVSS